MNPRIIEVIALSDYKMQLIFSNGERGVYDCNNLLDFGVFQELKNKNYFNQVKVLDGTVTRSHDQDICPDTLYLDAVKQ